MAQSGPLVLPPGTIVTGPVYRRNGTFVPSVSTGADANAYIFATPPTLSFVPNAQAAVVQTSAETQFVRFYTEGVTRPEGGFIAGSNVIRGKTAAEVKDLLALPYLPTSYTIVRVPAGTCVMGGAGAPILGNFPADPPNVPTPGPWGRGGVPQYYLVGKTSEPNCANPQFLPAADYVNRQLIGATALAYAPRAGAGNTGSVGYALDHANFPALFTDMDGIYNALDLINIGDSLPLQVALGQLGGEVYAAAANVEIANARSFLNGLSDRLRLARSFDPSGTVTPGAAAASGAGFNAGAWVSGFGGRGAISGDGNAHGIDFTGGGVAVGLDHWINPSMLVGAAVGFSRSNLNESGLASSGTVNFYSAALYGSYGAGPFYADASIGYGYGQTELNRIISFPGVQRATSGSGNNNAFLSNLEVGYRFGLGGQTTVAPLAGVQVVVLGRNSFSETGAGAVNLYGRTEATDSVRSILGGELRHTVPVNGTLPLTVSLRLAWAHEFGDTVTSDVATFEGLPGSAFRVQGPRVPRDTALIGVGLGANVEGIDFFVRYDGDASQCYNVHAATAGLKVQF